MDLRDDNRLFVALEVPEPHRARLGTLGRDLAERLEGRAVPSENLHATVAFLGSVAPEAGPLVGAALAAGAPDGPVPVEVGAVGARPSSRRARAVAVELAPRHDAQAQTLRELRDGLFRAAGRPVEERPLWLHVTLVRLRGRRRVEIPEQGPSDAERMFAFSRLALYDSQLGHGRPPRYVPVHAVELGAPVR